jgi:hypothetical protein
MKKSFIRENQGFCASQHENNFQHLETSDREYQQWLENSFENCEDKSAAKEFATD